MRTVIFDAGWDWDVLAVWRAELLGWHVEAERRPGWTAFTFTKRIGGEEFSIDGAGSDATELGMSLYRQRSGMPQGGIRHKETGRLCDAYCRDFGVLLHGNGVIGVYELSPFGDDDAEVMRRMKKDCNGRGEAHIYKWRSAFKEFVLDV